MPAGSQHFQIGSISCAVLTDGYYAYPSRWFFPNADSDVLERQARTSVRQSILSPYSCLLIETGRHVVLVDTGAGASLQTTGAIQGRLEMAGVRPRDVDTVVLTHAHPDHLGGAVNIRGRPAFPNARYVLAESEWEFWTAPHPDLSGMRVPDDLKQSFVAAARQALEALRFQLEPVGAEAEIVPGVRVIPAPGHTPGHLALLISSEGRRLLNIGDAATHPLHLENPDWENGFDLASSAANRTRRELLERAVSEEMSLIAFHFPFPSVGRVARRSEGGWRWTPGD